MNGTALRQSAFWLRTDRRSPIPTHRSPLFPRALPVYLCRAACNPRLSVGLDQSKWTLRVGRISGRVDPEPCPTRPQMLDVLGCPVLGSDDSQGDVDGRVQGSTSNLSYASTGPSAGTSFHASTEAVLEWQRGIMKHYVVRAHQATLRSATYSRTLLPHLPKSKADRSGEAVVDNSFQVSLCWAPAVSAEPFECGWVTYLSLYA